MLYQIIQTKNGKDTVKMIDTLQKCNNRLKELRASLRGKKVSFRIEKSEETDKFEAQPIFYDDGKKEHPSVVRKKK